MDTHTFSHPKWHKPTPKICVTADNKHNPIPPDLAQNTHTHIHNTHSEHTHTHNQRTHKTTHTHKKTHIHIFKTHTHSQHTHTHNATHKTQPTEDTDYGRRWDPRGHCRQRSTVHSALSGSPVPSPSSWISAVSHCQSGTVTATHAKMTQSRPGETDGGQTKKWGGGVTEKRERTE